MRFMRYENEHGDQVNVEVTDQIDKLYMEAEKKRWIASKACDHHGEVHWGEVAAKYEALAHIIAPPRYCFTGYNKYDQCSGKEYQIRVLEEALAEDPGNFHLEVSIDALKEVIQE